MMKKALTAIAAVIGIVFIFVIGSRYVRITPMEPTQNGLPASTADLPASSDSDTSVAPSFTLETLGGKPVSLKEFRGKPLVLNFWASW
ncbi:hypothetical protein KKC1_04130 [Calderihabitans maritimus]|uniref:Alkyl hydroperoxide reductase subunit C/ Thiol specific antioxidant domain-containing protein n=1 Tax=Calderihabitans maritimus TaxID=1246530 RepID=A0A1Z5HPK2_9FIRM|nr:hypothetical protein KKC1_04130 [Calderihabitans maritimus]